MAIGNLQRLEVAVGTSSGASPLGKAEGSWSPSLGSLAHLPSIAA